MSQNPKEPDIQLIDDVATGEHFLRLHLDIPMPSDQFEEVRTLLLQNKQLDSRSLIQVIGNEATSPYLELFFNPPV